jgi:Ni/Fe-hydrogenase subunit HybB-like protein
MSRNRPPVGWGTLLLAPFVLLGLSLLVVRFTRGIGAVSNLNDAYPWGVWIGFDVLTGVALAAGGFTMAGAVYVFGLERYRPLVRPAILTAFLGYLLVIGGLMVDLGRPWAIWKPLVFWQPESVMFEVAWCVTLYTTVLALEFSPVVFERFGLATPLRLVRRIMPPLVIAGVILSTLHQSSLGSLFLIAPAKLHALWYTPMLPLLFLVSAVMTGPAMVIFEAVVSARAFGRAPERDLLLSLGRVLSYLLGVYLVLRGGDLVVRGVTGALTPTPQSLSFAAEVLAGGVLPFVILLSRRTRESLGRLFGASSLVLFGVVLNRLNVAVVGISAASWQVYVPAWSEIAISLSMVAAGVIAFGLAVTFLPVWAESR